LLSVLSSLAIMSWIMIRKYWCDHVGR
jgi:hypothetical protein